MQREVMLIHGTWARDAEWVKKDSSLARRIQQDAPEVRVVEPFHWSGDNDFVSRVRAGDELAAHLSALAPGTQVYLVAHSRGGSVVHYAWQRHPQAFSQVVGIACMATPFFGFSIRPGYGALFAALVVALSVVALHLVMAALMYAGLHWSRSFTDSMTGPLAASALGFFVVLGLFVAMFKARRAVLDAIVNRARPLLALDTTVIQPPRCAYFRSSGDEVALGLSTGQFLTTVTNRVLGRLASLAQQLVHWATKLSNPWPGKVALSLFAVFLALASALPAAIQASLGYWWQHWRMFLWVFSGDTACGLDEYRYIGMAACVLLQATLWFDMVVVILSVLLVIVLSTGWLIGFVILGLFGVWSPVAALAVEFAIEPTPEGWQKFYNAGWSRDAEALQSERPGLQHSDPYSSEAAQSALCKHMRAAFSALRP